MPEFDEFGTPIDTNVTVPDNTDATVYSEFFHQPTAPTSSNPADFHNTGWVASDVSGADQAVWAQQGYARGIATGVDAAVAAQSRLPNDTSLIATPPFLPEDASAVYAGMDVGQITTEKDKTAGVFNNPLTNVSNIRLGLAGLLPGGLKGVFGKSVARGLKGPVSWVENGTPTSSDVSDWRVKISVAPESGLFYTDDCRASVGIMDPLRETGGVIYPYLPQINVTHSAGYGTQKLTHSNYSSFFYEGSEVTQIQIMGDFTVQNEDEGRYLLACIYFFRSVTKMFFGQDKSSMVDRNPKSGTPPPLVFLSGFGTHYFPNVPCAVTNFTHAMTGDVDYMEIPVQGGVTRLPTKSSLQVTLQPVYSRARVREFNHRDFSDGKLLNKGFI